MTEFKVSKTESYFFEKVDSSLLIVYQKERPEIVDVQRELETRNVEIVQSCIPTFKEFLNQVGRSDIHSILKECIIPNNRYVFKAEFDETLEDFTIYWIRFEDPTNINHITVDKIAIPTLIRFIEKNYIE